MFYPIIWEQSCSLSPLGNNNVLPHYSGTMFSLTIEVQCSPSPLGNNCVLPHHWGTVKECYHWRTAMLYLSIGEQSRSIPSLGNSHVQSHHWGTVMFSPITGEQSCSFPSLGNSRVHSHHQETAFYLTFGKQLFSIPSPVLSFVHAGYVTKVIWC